MEWFEQGNFRMDSRGNRFKCAFHFTKAFFAKYNPDELGANFPQKNDKRL